MLRNNLASRPFYNQRAAGAVLALGAAVVVALTAFNAWQFVSLSSERGALRDQIAANQAQVLQIRSDTAAVQSGLNISTLNGLLVWTQEANSLIDRRAFSWTVFFGYIERTLPFDVRLVAVVPRLAQGVFTVEMLVVTRTPEDLEDFVRALRDTKVFVDVYPKSEQANDDGTLGATLSATYRPPTLSAPASGGGRP